MGSALWGIGVPGSLKLGVERVLVGCSGWEAPIPSPRLPDRCVPLVANLHHPSSLGKWGYFLNLSRAQTLHFTTSPTLSGDRVSLSFQGWALTLERTLGPFKVKDKKPKEDGASSLHLHH